MATIIKQLPQNIDYEVWQGDTFAPGIITADISGTPINFTGYSAKIELRGLITGDVALTLTSPSSGITLSSAGVITITMTAAQTDALLGDYKYDLQITSPTAAIRTYTFGVISVYNDNTAN
jgi:hypothetical protein